MELNLEFKEKLNNFIIKHIKTYNDIQLYYNEQEEYYNDLNYNKIYDRLMCETNEFAIDKISNYSLNLDNDNYLSDISSNSSEDNYISNEYDELYSDDEYGYDSDDEYDERSFKQLLNYHFQ